MSQYGPAFFIKRKDGEEISEKEQKELLELVNKVVKDLEIKDDDGDIVSPEFYDYGDYEEKSASFLIYSSAIFAMMPEEVQNETEESDAKKILKIGEEIDKVIPDTYSYDCYYVED